MIDNETPHSLWMKLKPSPLILRCLSCGFLFPLGAAFILLPLFWIAIPLVCMGAWLMWEWIDLVGIIHKRGKLIFLGVGIFAMGISIFGNMRWGFAGLLLAAVISYYIQVWGGMVSALRRGRGVKNSAQGNFLFWGFIYIGLPLLSFIALRRMPSSGPYLFWVLGVVWTTDIMAYIVGSLLKGPKLWARLSPSKTWTGAAGGVLSAVVVSLAFGDVCVDASSGFLLGWGACFSVLSIGGDLMESALKRRFFKKDSGSLIPGHGGILDRLDGTLVVLPMAALLYYWREGLFQIGW